MAKINNVEMLENGSAKVWYDTGTCKSYKTLPKTVIKWLEDNKETVEETIEEVAVEEEVTVEEQTATVEGQTETVEEQVGTVEGQLETAEEYTDTVESDTVTVEEQETTVEEETETEEEQDYTVEVEVETVEEQDYTVEEEDIKYFPEVVVIDQVEDTPPVEEKKEERRHWGSRIKRVANDIWAVACIVGYWLTYLWWAIEDTAKLLGKGARVLATGIRRLVRFVVDHKKQIRTGIEKSCEVVASISGKVFAYTVVFVLLAVNISGKVAETIKKGWTLREEIIREERVA